VAITVTPEEKAQLEKENSLIRELPGANGANTANYHNPVTGQEMSGPVDPYHMTRRLRQGWRLGSAPTELKEKWVIREQELKEEDDRIVEEHKNSEEGRAERAGYEQNFSEAVATATATAVDQVLERLGYAQAPQEEAETEVDSAQSDFFQAVDSPTESETKLNVSQESRPELHLVE
jgi:hypothetical protein